MTSMPSACSLHTLPSIKVIVRQEEVLFDNTCACKNQYSRPYMTIHVEHLFFQVFDNFCRTLVPVRCSDWIEVSIHATHVWATMITAIQQDATQSGSLVIVTHTIC